MYCPCHRKSDTFTFRYDGEIGYFQQAIANGISAGISADGECELTGIDMPANFHVTSRAGIIRRIWGPATFLKPGLCKQ
jgi:hypothetical protein